MYQYFIPFFLNCGKIYVKFTPSPHLFSLTEPFGLWGLSSLNQGWTPPPLLRCLGRQSLKLLGQAPPIFAWAALGIRCVHVTVEPPPIYRAS